MKKATLFVDFPSDCATLQIGIQTEEDHNEKST